MDIDDHILSRQLEDMAEASSRDGLPRLSDFLDPAQQEAAARVLEKIPGVSYTGFGGYKKAERKKIAVMPAVYLSERIDTGICAIEIQFQTGVSGRELKHGDFLGAVLGLGIKREKIGDILVDDQGCQIILAKEMSNFVVSNLEKVGRQNVSVREIELDELRTPVEHVSEVRKTVASLRLDAIASAGFSTSRTKMAQDIKAKRVRLNWKVTTDPDAQVKVGDVISIRGRGRLSLDQLGGETKKGRLSVVIKKYV